MRPDTGLDTVFTEIAGYILFVVYSEGQLLYY